MYAIVKDGGKNYKVEPGQVIRVEKKDLEAGATVEFPEVMFYSSGDNVQVGTPLVEKVKVEGTVEKHVKGDKVTVFKFKRRKDYKKKQGHRQKYTQVRIDKITKE